MKFHRRDVLLQLPAALIAMRSLSARGAEPAVAPAGTKSKIVSHPLSSAHQAGPTLMRVLSPDAPPKDRPLRVVYVLPVEAGTESRYGDGLDEIRRRNLHNRLGVLCVAPTFFHLPWYADHPTDGRIAQETYFLKDVLPLVEKTYPVEKTRSGRLLLGFSKSGWGAFTLFLRHPDLFERAVAWDAPFRMNQHGPYGSGPIFGTAANFEKHRVPELLKKERERLVGKPERLSLSGYCTFQKDHETLHGQLMDLGIPHHYLDEKRTPHDWHSGWVEPSMEWLCRADDAPRTP